MSSALEAFPSRHRVPANDREIIEQRKAKKRKPKVKFKVAIGDVNGNKVQRTLTLVGVK